MTFSRSAALCLGLSCLVQAQEAPGLGFQLNFLSPLQNLRDANGGKQGLGASLMMNFPLEDGWAWRASLGYNRFPKGNSVGTPTTSNQIDVSHLVLEGVYQLRDTPGPYVFAGLGGYSWNIQESDTVSQLSTSHRVAHLGASLGIGYRITPNWEIEVRGMGGKVDPDFTAGWAGLAVAWRF